MPILFSKMDLITENGNENCDDTTFRRVFCGIKQINEEKRTSYPEDML